MVLWIEEDEERPSPQDREREIRRQLAQVRTLKAILEKIGACLWAPEAFLW